jgi:hypothetical protein
MLTKIVKDGKGCNIGVERLRIAKVTNLCVIYYSLNKDLDAVLSGLVGLVVLD